MRSGKSTTAKIALGVIKPGRRQARNRQNPACARFMLPAETLGHWTLPLTVARFMRLPAACLGSVGARAGLSATGYFGILLASECANSLRLQIPARHAGPRHCPNLTCWFLDEPRAGRDYSARSRSTILSRPSAIGHRCERLLISHDLHVVMAAPTG